MSGLSTAFLQFFSAITVLFSAFERFARTADNIGKVAEESSAAYADDAAETRQIKLAKLKHDREQQRKALAIESSAS